MSRATLWAGLAVWAAGCGGGDEVVVAEKTEPKPQNVITPAQRRAAEVKRWAARLGGTKRNAERQRLIDRLAKSEAPPMEVAVAVLPALDSDINRGLGQYLPGEVNSAREAAIVLIRRVGNPDNLLEQKAIPALKKALAAGDPAVREHAVETAGRLGEAGQSLRPRLVALTADPSQEVRLAAWGVLQEMELDAAAATTLTGRLADSEAGVRDTASENLYWLPAAADHLPVYTNAVNDPSQKVVMAALRTLTRLGEKAGPAVPTVIGRLRDIAKKIAAREAVDDLSPLACLARIGEPAVPKLAELLADPDANVRYLAALTLGLIGPDAKAAVDALGKRLDDAGEAPLVRMEAAAAIVRAGGDAGPPSEQLRDWLRSPNVAVRQAAVAAAGKLGRAAGPLVPELLKRLGDPREEAEVKQAAVQTLGGIGPLGPSAVKALGAQLITDNEDVRGPALAILEKLGPAASEAQADLTDLVAAEETEADPETRRRAALVLARFGAKAAPAVPTLAKVVRDENLEPTLRQAAATALGETAADPQTAVPALASALKTRVRNGEPLRQAAMVALGQYGPAAASAVSALAEEVNKGRAPHRRAAIRSLGRIGPQASAAVETLVEEATGKYSDSGDLPIWAAAALVQIQPEKAGEYLPKLTAALATGRLGPNDSGRRLAALQAADDLGDAAAPLAGAVRKLTDAAEADVREAAAAALGRVGNASAAVDALSRRLDDPEAEVRLAAVRSLAERGAAARRTLAKLKTLARTDEKLRAAAQGAIAAIDG